MPLSICNYDLLNAAKAKEGVAIAAIIGSPSFEYSGLIGGGRSYTLVGRVS